MRKTRRDFHREATHEPYELELDTTHGEDGQPVVVTFINPNRMEAQNSFRYARMTDPEEQLKMMLGPDFAEFWAEWRAAPVDELLDLINDVNTYYNGVDVGKSVNSTR